MTRFVLALDQGTTSSRSILFDHAGAIVATAQREFTQHFPRSGWVEHDAEEIWATQAATIAEVLARAARLDRRRRAVGITNQRETTVLWERATGRPVAPAIVWQDRRTADFCARLKADGHEPEITRRTGLLLDPYFSGTKLALAARQRPGAARAGPSAASSRSARSTAGSPGSSRAARSTSPTRRTRAARCCSTSRLATGTTTLLDLLRIPRALLPRVVPSSLARGEAFAVLGGREVPIGGIAGDQQAALFGQACFAPGMAKNTYGTGCFMLMNTGDAPVGVGEPAADDRGLAARRASLRARGRRVHRRRRRPVAARRARDHRDSRPRSKRWRRTVPDAGGVVPGPGVHRPRRAALGRLRARHHGRPLARHDQGPHRSRGARVDRVPERGRAARDAARREAATARSCASTAARPPTT